MVNSSPARRSYNYVPSSPLSEILYTDRNSEARHKQMLEASRREHERVHQLAKKALEDHRREEERRQIVELERREQERIRKEKELAAERKRLHELQAQKIEIPPEPPKPKTAPTPTAPASGAFGAKAPTTSTSTASAASAATSSAFGAKPLTSASQTSAGPSTQPAATTSATKSSTQPAPAAPSNPFGQAPSKPAASQQPAAVASPFAAALQKTSSPFVQAQAQAPAATASSPFAAAAKQAPAQQQNGATGSQAPAKAAPRGPDRYEVIHKNLKDLRRLMMDQAKQNPALKNRMGDMRREIRKIIGQLTNGAGAKGNSVQIKRIQHLIKEALVNDVRSQLVDPSILVLEPREPQQGAENNGEVPSLFLYLLNIFAKTAINQFINEAGPRPETADPVGVTVAAIFAEPSFLWRGKSLIDILLAKFRVVCPVLFGHNGNEKYEDGRRRLGWHKEGGSWVPEQQHFDRMTGLGAGYAAISLRNFNRSKKKNPFPPTNYWTAFARIVNTPPAEISNTQAIVLKAMIQHYDGKFLEAYGNAAREALRIALVDFPRKCPAQTPATQSLQVLAQTLKKESLLIIV
ncbi:GLE1-like protein-domain-containing protein [Coniochaeta sp. 2T2.1]|nr:GLE1-like protein-domain-containing protein [Coniochaeta sp. 2T2.1]